MTKAIFQTVIQLLVQDTSAFEEDDANEPGSVQRNFKRHRAGNKAPKWVVNRLEPIALARRLPATSESFRSILFNLRSADLQWRCVIG